VAWPFALQIVAALDLVTRRGDILGMDSSRAMREILQEIVAHKKRLRMRTDRDFVKYGGFRRYEDIIWDR
jgi:hypothetical protein